jgi:YVTN family beta-propeller protein
VFILAAALPSGESAMAAETGPRPSPTVTGMPAVVDPNNLYSETRSDKLSPAVAKHLSRVYVPNRTSNDVWVIDPESLKVIDKFKVGINPQHVVPSWDLKTLWVNNNAEGRHDGSVTPIDPLTGKPGKNIPVDDPYNMYFTPDGSAAIIVAEARKRLDFRDPQTMAMKYSIETPQCAGINHADFSADGRYAIFTCEFAQTLAKVDLVEKRVVGYLKLSKGGMPQDARISPDGKVFYIADMKAEGVFIIDAEKFSEIGHIKTGLGAHGLYPSRDGKKLYVANRGVAKVYGPPKGKGSVSVVDFTTRKVEATWTIPGGGSPDMGNVSIDGKQLWLSGRYDNEIYVFDTASGSVKKIPVKTEPHGLTVWPQPGRYSLGHTGNMR